MANERRNQKWGEKPCPTCHGSGTVPDPRPDDLRTARIDSGSSLRSVARDLGYSAAYLSDIERGNRGGNTKIVEYYGRLTDGTRTTEWTKGGTVKEVKTTEWSR